MSEEAPMKPSRSALVVAALVGLALAVPCQAQPSFKKRNSVDKAFLTKVGEAAVKAFRTKPANLELEDFKIALPRPTQQVIDLKMTWSDAAGKRFTSDVRVIIDFAEKDKWKVLDVEYKDNNVARIAGGGKRIESLKAELNR